MLFDERGRLRKTGGIREKGGYELTTLQRNDVQTTGPLAGQQPNPVFLKDPISKRTPEYPRRTFNESTAQFQDE